MKMPKMSMGAKAPKMSKPPTIGGGGKPHIRMRKLKTVAASAFPTAPAAFPPAPNPPTPDQSIGAPGGGMPSGAAPGDMGS